MIDKILGFACYDALWAGAILAYSTAWYVSVVYAEFETQKRSGRTFVLVAADFTCGIGGVLFYLGTSLTLYMMGADGLEVPVAIIAVIISLLPWTECWYMLRTKQSTCNRKVGIWFSIYTAAFIATAGAFFTADSLAYGMCNLCISIIALVIAFRKEHRKE